MTKNRTLLISFAAACAAISPAMAADVASRSFEIRGVVPVVCNAIYQPAIDVRRDGTIDLGAVAEFCNSGLGYRVVAEYSSAADPGVLIVDGRDVQLGAAGTTVIAEVAGPNILSRQLAYRPGTTTLTSLRIRLEAILI